MLWGLCSEWKALNLVIFFFPKNQMDVFSFLQQLIVNNDRKSVRQPGVLGGHLWELFWESGCCGNFCGGLEGDTAVQALIFVQMSLCDA